VASLAPALGVPAKAVIARLEGFGFDMSDPERALNEIAETSGKNAFALSAALTF
jgi:hypothetical protein